MFPRGFVLTKENQMAKFFMLLLLLGGAYAAIGCEAKVNDDGAKVKIDK
jgi:hypothetical protein